MDLRDLSSTPTQLDSVIQRRPSLSSLSSASGYDSSNYNPTTAQGHGQAPSSLSNQRSSNGINRIFPALSDEPSGPGLAAPASSSLATDVGPWVEQQKQQQSLNVVSLDAGDRPGEKHPPHMGSTKSQDHSQNGEMPASYPSSSVNNSIVVDEDDDDDELIPTAIVIKNIPFAIKKEQLLDVMTKLGLPLPYAFNYHFDNGVFRGLAFANFTSTAETSMVVNQLNGREIGGRKLRVEYKKMLPAQERERIEREKREKRGQLEEQHRSASNASLASLISATSTTAATKNLSVAGQNFPTQTERLFVQYPPSNSTFSAPPNDLNFNDPNVLELYSQLLTYRDDSSKLIFELAFPASLSMGQRKTLSSICSFLNLLELFDNGLIIIRRKPGQQSFQQRQQQSATFNTHLNHHQSSPMGPNSSAASNMPVQMSSMAGAGSSQQSTLQNGLSSHSSSMMNLSQMPLLYSNNIPSSSMQAPELLRSQSQSALPLSRSRQQTSTPVQQQYSQYQHHNSSSSKSAAGSQQPKYQNFGSFSTNTSGVPQQQGQIGTPASSAAALLRSSNNRSFVDVRSSPSLHSSFPSNSVTGSPTPSNQTNLYQSPGHYFLGQSGPSQQANDFNNRFTPFSHQNNVSGSIASLSSNTGTNEDHTINDQLNSKLGSLNLTGTFESQKGNGIWGPRK